MTTQAVPLRVRTRPRALAQPALDGLFLATILVVSFAKIQWSFSADLSLADVLTALFLVVFIWDRLERGDAGLTRTSIVALGFFAAFLLVYLIGYFNLDTHQALTQYGKGMAKFVLHLGFLVAGVTLLARRPHRFYWYALAAFCGGIALNGVYGVVQLAVSELTGGSLDHVLIQPITGRATNINIFGVIGGTQAVYRPNGLTGDPNHLGIELTLPLLILTPIYLRLERWHPLKVKLAVVLAFLLLVELATLSRSGLLGLGVGALVLAVPYRRYLLRRELLLPLAAVAVVVAGIVAVRFDYFRTVLKARTNVSHAAASPHFGVYSFIPDIFHTHPLFGLGLNNFAVYYEFVTGRPDFGPHSFYVSQFVESGIVGSALFVVFVLWIFQRLSVARRFGRAFDAVRDPLGPRVRPLAWGMTAALVATLASNIFYLTMTFYYFYVFAALAVAIPVVFARPDPGRA